MKQLLIWGLLPVFAVAFAAFTETRAMAADAASSTTTMAVTEAGSFITLAQAGSDESSRPRLSGRSIRALIGLGLLALSGIAWLFKKITGIGGDS